MNYDNAKTIIEETYSTQSNMLFTKLSQDAIITLANLYKNQNIKRQMTDATILRLSAMEPHRQCGFLTNPFLEFIIGRCCTPNTATTAAPSVSTPTNKTETKVNVKPDVKPVPKPEPEPDPEEDPEFNMDIFG